MSTEATRPAVSLATVAAACREVARQVHASGWRPEQIVAVSRGGLTPAHWLAHLLDVPRVTAVDVGFQGPERTVMACWSVPTFAPPAPRRLLVVEDAVDTCRLLAYAVSLLPGDVATAALWRTRRSPHVDYAAATVDRLPVMPWELLAESGVI